MYALISLLISSDNWTCDIFAVNHWHGRDLVTTQPRRSFVHYAVSISDTEVKIKKVVFSRRHRLSEVAIMMSENAFG